MTSLSARRERPLVLAVLALLLLVVGAPRAQAAVSFTLVDLSATVNGTLVTSSATVSAPTSTAVASYGICVRSSSGANLDYPKPAATISPAGTRTPKVSKTFAPGTYRYFVCVSVSGSWSTVGASKSFTVAPGATAPTGAPASAAAVPVPTGSVPGWKLAATQDFSTPAALGQVGAVYGSSMRGYDAHPDTTGHGWYAPDKVLSVRNGSLSYNLHTENGQPLSAAPVPLGWVGQTYGRYSVRFKTNLAPGYKMSFLLWPASSSWNEGEIDFPEGPLGETVYGASARKGSYANGTVAFDPSQAFAPTTTLDWHVATTEWGPGLVRWLWDGVEIGRTSIPSGVPSTGFCWVLQAETSSYGVYPAPETVGTIDVDWLAAYTYAP